MSAVAGFATHRKLTRSPVARQGNVSRGKAGSTIPRLPPMIKIACGPISWRCEVPVRNVSSVTPTGEISEMGATPTPVGRRSPIRVCTGKGNQAAEQDGSSRQEEETISFHLFISISGSVSVTEPMLSSFVILLYKISLWHPIQREQEKNYRKNQVST